MNGDNGIKEVGESYKGENQEGESKTEPEKALKDSRGGAGMNALDQVKADKGDAGKSGKVSFRSFRRSHQIAH